MRQLLCLMCIFFITCCTSSNTMQSSRQESYHCDEVIAEKIKKMEADLFPDSSERIKIKKNGMNLLHLVARSGQIDLAECLLHKKYPIDAQDKRGNTPLHYALINGHLELARFLIEKGAEVTLKNKSLHTTIHMAIFSMPGSDKETPSIAPLRGRISSPFGLRVHPIRGRYHFHSGIDIAAPLGKKIIASASGKVLGFRYKQGIGKVIVLKHKNGFQTRYGHCCGLGALRKNRTIHRGFVVGKVGATGNATGPHLHYEIVHDGLTINPYHFLPFASKHYDVTGIIALLVAKGAHVASRDRYGRAPIHYAAMRGIPAIRALVKNGSSVNVYDSKGLAPLHYAAFYSVPAARYLLRCKARVNARTKARYKANGNYYPRGLTPLKIALKNEWLTMAKLFVRYGGR
jgi:ankyrin repeat protein